MAMRRAPTTATPDASIVNGRAAATVTTSGEPAPEQFEIEIANFQFSPADAVVAAGHGSRVAQRRHRHPQHHLDR